MTDSLNIFNHDPSFVNQPNNYAATQAHMMRIAAERDKEQLRTQAALKSASARNISSVNDQGQMNSPDQIMKLVLADIERNPNSVSLPYVKDQLRRDPLIQEMARQGLIPAENIDALAVKLNQRHIAKENGQSVYNPELGDLRPEELVADANRPDAGFLDRLTESTNEILGFTGDRRSIEADIASVDKKLSAYPTEFKLAFGKYQELERAKIQLNNLRDVLKATTDPAIINQLYERMRLQQDRINMMQANITPQDQANMSMYGKNYLEDIRTREGLKAQEGLLTPRYPTTVAHEREIANIKQKHLAMGHSASFSDPASWTNGYVKDYMLTMADPDVLTKEIAPEVLPWVGINFLVDAGTAALTGGAGTPAVVAKWAAMIGMGANSAYQAIDKNIDQYFEQHGTTAGFSELRSHIMEGIAFYLDMYGGHMLAHGLPGSVDKLLKGTRKETMQKASEMLKAGQTVAEATGSAEPFKAAVKQAYQLMTGSTLLTKVGEALAESGAKSSALYGKGRIRQGLGASIVGGTLGQTVGKYTGKIGLEPVYTAYKDAALSLAAENMMSETARQVGRQNGMNADTVIESGLKGLVAGPIGRTAGKALGVTRAAVKGYNEAIVTGRDMYTDDVMKGTERLANEVIGGNTSQGEADEIYSAIKDKQDHLTESLDKESNAKSLKKQTDRLIDDHAKSIDGLSKTEKTKDIYVNKKGQQVEEGTKGAVQVTVPAIDLQEVKEGDPDSVKDAKRSFNKGLEKIWKKAYTEATYRAEREAQRDQFAKLTEQMRKSGKVTENTIENKKTDAELKAEKELKDSQYSPLANKTAQEIREGKEPTEFKALNKLELDKLNDIFKEDVTRDVVDQLKNKSPEEINALKKAIEEIDREGINKGLEIKSETKEEEKKPEEKAEEKKEAPKAEVKGTPIEGEIEKVTPEKKAEAKPKTPSKPQPKQLSEEAFKDYKDKQKSSTVDLDNLTKSDLIAKDLATAEELKDFDKLKGEIAQLYAEQSKAGKLQAAAKEAQAISDNELGIEKTASAPKVTVSDKARELFKKIQEHNNELRIQNRGKGTKALKEEEKKQVVIENDRVVKITAENEYENMQRNSGAKNFWKTETKEVQQALKNAAVKAARKNNFGYGLTGAFKSEVKALKNKEFNSVDEFIEAYNTTPAAKKKPVEAFLQQITEDLYTERYNQIKALKEKVQKETEYVAETAHGYKGYTAETAERLSRRQRKEAMVEELTNGSLRRQAEAYDGEFLWNKNYSDGDILNFASYIIDTQVLGYREDGTYSAERLKDLEKLKKSWESAQRASVLTRKKDGKIARKDDKDAEQVTEEVRKQRLNRYLLDLLKHFYKFKSDRYEINERALNQLDLLIKGLAARANSGKSQNFKALADYLYQIQQITNYLIDEGTIDKVNEQGFDLWNDSTKFAAAQIYAGEKAKDRRIKYNQTKLWEELSDQLWNMLNQTDKSYAEKTLETYAQLWEVNDIYASAEHQDVRDALVQWCYAHTHDVESKLLNLMNDDANRQKLWKALQIHWSRDRRNHEKEGSILRNIFDHAIDRRVRDFLSVGENKPADTAVAEIWENRWKEADSLFKGKILNALLNNQVTLAGLFDIPMKNKSDVSNPTTAARIIDGIYTQLTEQQFYDLDVIKSADERFVVHIATLLRKQQLLSKAVFAKIVHTKFYEGLRKDLQHRIVPEDQFKKDTINNEEFFILNGYKVKYRLTPESRELIINAKADPDAAERWEDAESEAFKAAWIGKNAPEYLIWRMSRKKEDLKKPAPGGKYKGLTLKEAYKQWSKDYRNQHPHPIHDNLLPHLQYRYEYAEANSDNWQPAEAIQDSDDSPINLYIPGVNGAPHGSLIATTDATSSSITERAADRIIQTGLNTISDEIIETFEKASLEDMKNLRKVLKDLQLDLERTGYNESFLRNHLGEYIVLKWLEKNKDFADKNSKDAEEFFTHFNNIFSYVNVTAPKYNSKEDIELAGVTERDLTKILDVLEAAGRTPTRKELEKFLKGFSEVDSGNLEVLLNKVYDKDTFRYPESDLTITKEQKRLLAQALQNFINQDASINNKVTGNTDNIIFTVTEPENDALNMQTHQQVEGLTFSEYFKPRPRNSILLYSDGLARAASQNPELIHNPAFQAIIEGARSLYGQVEIPSQEDIAALECDYSGKYYDHVINIAVTAGVATFVKSSSETSEDFLNQLKVTAPGAHKVYSNPANHIIDQSNFMESAGKMVANVLGYKKDTILYDRAVARFGQIAVLGLMHNSYVDMEQIYVNRYTGDILPPTAENKANCIAALRITNVKNQQALNEAFQTTDADGSTANWADKLLGLEFNAEEDLHTKEVRTKKDLQKFKREAAVEGRTNDLHLDEKNKIDFSQITTTTWTNPDDKSKTVEAKIIKLEDMAMVALPDSNGEYSEENVVIFSHDAYEKTDFTHVSDARLVLLAKQAEKGVNINIDEWRSTFQALGLIENVGGKWQLTDIAKNPRDMTLDKLEALCKQNTFLAMFLHTNSKYGMDPNTRTGKDWLKTSWQNLMDFQKICKDAKSLFNIDGTDYVNSNEKTVNVFYTEMNTVNNRLFVKSNTFNYREFKHWRSIISVNNLKNRNFIITSDIQRAMFVAPILFNLGFDVDKLESGKELNELWDKLCKTAEFKDLLTKVQNANGDYGVILKAIQEYNGTKISVNGKEVALKKIKGNEYAAETGRTYISYKTPEGVRKSLGIGESFEAVTCLSKMVNVQITEDGKNKLSLIDYITNNTNHNIPAKFGFTGYDITIEIDGLTNGPSFKNIASPLISNTDEQSRILIGATGASNEFFNIIDGYRNYDILDTYNLNGKFVKDQLSVDSIREFFRGSTELTSVMKYMQVLYNPDNKEVDGQTIPSEFLDDIVEVMNEVFTRDFMKSPTMVIGYEAGKLSVIQTIMNDLDRRFSNDLADAINDGKTDVFQKWINAVSTLTGQKFIQAEFVDKNHMVQKAMINVAQGTIEIPGAGHVAIKSLTREQLKKISVSHADIAGLNERLSNLFGKFYDSIAKKKELVQKPYKLLNDCSLSLANCFDLIVRSAIDKYIDDKGVADIDYTRTMQDIVKYVYEQVNAVINVGIEIDGERSKLSLTKKDITSCVVKAMGVYTRTKDGRFVKSTLALAGRTSLGAGTVPMFVHSYDSSVIHMMMQKVMSIMDERILTIHDAELASITQLHGKWGEIVEETEYEKDSDGKLKTDENGKAIPKKVLDVKTREVNSVLKANQAHYEAGHMQLVAFADICNNLTKAINALMANSELFNINPAAHQSMVTELKQRREAMFKLVFSMGVQRKAFYQREKAIKDPANRWHDFQYSAFATDSEGTSEAEKAALGAFAPNDTQLDQYIKVIDDMLDSIKVPQDMNKVVTEVQAYLLQKLSSASLKAVFEKDVMRPIAISHLTSGDDFINWLKDVTTEPESTYEGIRSTIQELFKKDPESTLRKELINSFAQSTDAEGQPINTAKPNSDVDFISTVVGLLGDRKKDFGSDRPTDLLITDDNNILYTRAIDALYALHNRIPSHFRNTFIGKMLGMRFMTRMNQADADQFKTFLTLLTPFFRREVNLSKYNSSKAATVVYSDSFDYLALDKKFSHQVSERSIINNDKGVKYYNQLSTWFETLKQDMKTMVDNAQSDQFVFTLRSDGDIWRMLALQEVFNENADLYKDKTISIIPAISNLSQASPVVNEEVAILQKLNTDNTDMNAVYFTSTETSHNVKLQEAVVGHELSILGAEGNIRATSSPKMMVMNDRYNAAQQIPMESFKKEGNACYRRDELNQEIKTSSAYSEDVYPTDLKSSPINKPYTYNIRLPYEKDYRETDYVTNVPVDQLENMVTFVEGRLNFDEILGNDNSTVIVQTEANGEILDKGLEIYSKLAHNPLNEAYAIYQKELKKKRDLYERSNHEDRQWQLYMTPIVVTVRNFQNQEKVFIFKPSIDNSITIESLRNSIHQAFMGDSNRIAQINEGSPLALMLNRTDDKGVIDRVEKLRLDNANKVGNHRIVIPKDLLPKDQLSELGAFVPSWLASNNAAYLTSILDNDLASRGIRMPVDSIAPYQFKNTDKTVPMFHTPNGTSIKYVGLDKIPPYWYEMSAQAQQMIQRDINEDKLGQNLGETLQGFVRSYMGKIPGVNKLVHSYVGTVSNIPGDYKWQATDTILDYSNAGNKFQQLMLRSIERDKAKGLDTSLVERNLGFMQDLVTLAYVRIGQTQGIESSQQATLLLGEIGEREFLNIGTTGTYESEAEAFMHEMLHTLWRHLNASNPGLRKKLSDMYNYVSANFNINYFEDGGTLRNQQIMEAVFGKDTQDNVEEFLCYYLTNKAFHDAVNNMANQKHTKLSEVLESNTKGIFRKLLNSAQNLLAGKFGIEKQPDTIESLAQKALSTAMNYNNKYWLRKQNLIETATKEEISTDMILGLKEPAYKVLDKLYDDSVFTKAVQLAVQKIYKAFGAEDTTAAYVSAHIGATEEFNRITETGEQLADNLIEAKRDYLNAEDGFVNDLLSSMEGVSRSQYDYLILRTKSKAVIDQQREQMGAAVNEAVREVLKDVPEKIAKHLTMQFIHMDMSCLFRNTDLTLNQIKKVLTDKQTREKHIKTLERTFASDRYATYYKNAAKGLAQYLVTGFNPTGLNYRNAYEIMARAGSINQASVAVGSAAYNALDQLISLYALDMLDTSKVNVFELIPIETLNRLAVIHNAVKDSDNKEIYFNNSSMHLHVPKGELHGGTTYNRYEIIPEAELEAYEWNGYKKVSDAELDPFFKSHTTGKYVMVRAAYKSPAVTTAGIFTLTNIFKGRTQVGINIGSVLGRSIDSQTSSEFRKTTEYKDLRNYVQARIDNLNTANPSMIQKPTSGNMLLNFNMANHLSGATFEVNPIERLKQTGRNVKITSVLGDLYGSTIERTLTPKRNAAVAQSVIDIYENATDKENFVWIAPNSENEKYRDLYEHLPMEVKEGVTERYGEKGLPVRLKALNSSACVLETSSTMGILAMLKLLPDGLQR